MIEVSRDGVSIRSDVVCNVILLSAQCSVLARCYQAASSPLMVQRLPSFYAAGVEGRRREGGRGTGKGLGV